MTKKRKTLKIEWLKNSWPYILAGIFTLALVFVGSIDKHNSNISLSMNALAQSGQTVSVDQMSALYTVASVSDSLNLASASDVASNYIVVNSMHDAGQTAEGKVEKPNIPLALKKAGFETYTVGADDTIDSIADKYGVSTDQIRWSNGLKSKSISEGDVLYVPTQSGVVYTVKSDDTFESIALRYGANAERIEQDNNLEIAGLTEGDRIFIRDGVPPSNERPEYSTPVRTNTYAYSYLGNTAMRKDISVVGYFYGLGGPYASGYCTQWAWYKRQDIPKSFGNAYSWARAAAAYGYEVNRTPSAGAIFQTSYGGGGYGHVGYVESVNSDGSIVITEMNYGVLYRVTSAVIPADQVGNFNYIH